MKSNRQARHLMGLDYKVSNTRKVVTKAVSYTHLRAHET